MTSNVYMPEIGMVKVGANGVPVPKVSPLEAYRYLEARRQTITDSLRQRPMLRLWDSNHQYIGQIAQEKSVQVDEVTADSGGFSVVVRRDNWLSDTVLYDRRSVEDLHFTLDPNPTDRSWRTRFGGKITEVNAKRGSDGLHTIELNGVSNREHLKHILCAATPFSPPEFQPLKLWMLPWNIRTGLTLSLFINLARMYEPFLSIPTNILNPIQWLTTKIGNINPMNWPVQPQYINPLTDQSRTEVFTSRWGDMHSSSAAVLEDAGCIWRAYTWLTEDEESPHPELAQIDKSVNAATRPTRNAVILAVEDKSGVSGPTGTLIDGPINLIASVADDLVTETLLPQYDKDGNGQTDPLIRTWFAVAPEAPRVVFRDTEYSAIVESERTMHGSSAMSQVVGGRSPGWVNQAQTFGIKYGLSALSDLFYAPSGGGVAAASIAGYQIPATGGLEEVYQGQLDDMVLSYARRTDVQRALQAGDHAFLENYESGSGSAYTVSGELDLRTGAWKTRPRTAFKVSIRNGFPWIANLDFLLGDRAAFEMANILHVDNITGIRYAWDKDTPVRVELTVGDKQQENDPVGTAVRALAGFWNVFGTFMGGQNLF